MSNRYNAILELIKENLTSAETIQLATECEDCIPATIALDGSTFRMHNDTTYVPTEEEIQAKVDSYGA
jgi:hypothetical protein